MSQWIHAFCLDEAKEQPDHAELVVGPFDWVIITWDVVRAGDNSNDSPDFQFTRHGSGFWYPVARVHQTEDGRGWASNEPDPSRGRFTDIAILTEEPQGYEIVRDALREVPSSEAYTVALEWANENAWLETPEEGDEEPTIAMFVDTLEYDDDHKAAESFDEFLLDAPDRIAELWGQDGPGAPYLITQHQLNGVLEIIGSRCEDRIELARTRTMAAAQAATPAAPTDTRPPEGWSGPDARGHYQFVQHNAPFTAEPPAREGYEAYWIGRHGDSWTRWEYKPVEAS